MKQIRRNVFETNSSSTHSICVTKNDILDDKMNNLYFRLDEFGWEHSRLRYVGEKASYLYTGIVCNGRMDLLKKVKKVLDKNNIEYEFEDPEEAGYFYIDHGSNLTNFLNDICNNEDKLMRYLFSSESFIITSNDNSYYNDDIDVDYEYEEYYKGN